MLAGGKLFLRSDTVLVLLRIGERVIEFRLAAHEQQPPTTEPSALGDNHSCRAAAGNVQCRGDLKRPLENIGGRIVGNAADLS